MRKQSIVIGALAAFALSCTVAAQTAQPVSAVKPVAASADYHRGFSDACGHVTFGTPQNGAQYKDNPDYRAGWDAGLLRCYDHDTIRSQGDPNAGTLHGLF